MEKNTVEVINKLKKPHIWPITRTNIIRYIGLSQSGISEQQKQISYHISLC